MTITVIQSTQNGTSANSTSITATYSTTTTAGNLLVAIVNSRNAESVSLSDSAGNTWVQVNGSTGFVTDGTNYGSMWYVENALANAGVVTVTFGGSHPFHCLAIYEVSGISTTSSLDAVMQTSGSGTAISSGTLALTTSNEIIIAGGLDNGQPITAFGAGYTGVNWAAIGDAHKYFFHQYHIVTAPEAATATQTTNTSWFIVAGSFSTTPIVAALNVSQITEEVLSTNDASVRTSGTSIGVLRSTSSIPTQVLVAQVNEEVLRAKVAQVNVSQLTEEVLRAKAAQVNVSQLTVQVMRSVAFIPAGGFSRPWFQVFID